MCGLVWGRGPGQLELPAGRPESGNTQPLWPKLRSGDRREGKLHLPLLKMASGANGNLNSALFGMWARRWTQRGAAMLTRTPLQLKIKTLCKATLGHFGKAKDDGNPRSGPALLCYRLIHNFPLFAQTFLLAAAKHVHQQQLSSRSASLQWKMQRSHSCLVWLHSAGMFWGIKHCSAALFTFPWAAESKHWLWLRSEALYRVDW